MPIDSDLENAIKMKTESPNVDEHVDDDDDDKTKTIPTGHIVATVVAISHAVAAVAAAAVTGLLKFAGSG